MQNNIIVSDEGKDEIEWWVNVAEWVDIVCSMCIRQDYCALDFHMLMCENVCVCMCVCESMEC